MTRLRCPICDALFDPERTPAMPFCSARCQQIDLRRWLTEEHAIPSVKSGSDEQQLDDQAVGEDGGEE